MELAAEYRAGRERIATLVLGLSDADLDRTVPACPDWRVRDLVYHLAGVASDVVHGNMEGAPGTSWSDKQVAARQGQSMPEVIDEWAASAGTLEPMIEAAGDKMFF